MTSSPEFTWSWDKTLRCYVIRRSGSVYHVIQTGMRKPAHTRTYVERTVALLNGED